jgi:hypothetical protein
MPTVRAFQICYEGRHSVQIDISAATTQREGGDLRTSVSCSGTDQHYHVALVKCFKHKENACRPREHMRDKNEIGGGVRISATVRPAQDRRAGRM